MPNDWSCKPEPNVPPLPPRDYSVLDQITDSVISQIAARLLAQYTQTPAGKPFVLTAQELRIATMMGCGTTMKDIAKAMTFSHPSDVHNRVRACCRRLGITRHQLAVYGAFLAMRKGEL